MQSIRRSSRAKKLLLVALAVIIVAALLFVYLYVIKGTLFGWSPVASHTAASSSQGNNPPTEDQIKSGATIKQQSLDQATNPKGSSGSDTPPSPVPGNNGKSVVGVTITAANQNNGTVQIRALIAAVDTGGTCTLTLSQAGHQTVTKTAGTQNLSSTSTCQGFDIPVSELSTGTWSIAIAYSSSTLTGNASGSITVK